MKPFQGEFSSLICWHISKVLTQKFLGFLYFPSTDKDEINHVARIPTRVLAIKGKSMNTNHHPIYKDNPHLASLGERCSYFLYCHSNWADITAHRGTTCEKKFCTSNNRINDFMGRMGQNLTLKREDTYVIWQTRYQLIFSWYKCSVVWCKVIRWKSQTLTFTIDRITKRGFVQWQNVTSLVVPTYEISLKNILSQFLQAISSLPNIIFLIKTVDCIKTEPCMSLSKHAGKRIFPWDALRKLPVINFTEDHEMNLWKREHMPWKFRDPAKEP